MAAIYDILQFLGVQYVPRWRHTANLVDGGVVIIIGGRSKGHDVMADIWQVDTATWRMECVSNNDGILEQLHYLYNYSIHIASCVSYEWYTFAC